MQKKQLTETDYSRWGELIPEKMSSDAQWICYRMMYENDVDTLFVRNTKSLKTYSFPKGVFPLFASSNYVIFKDEAYRYILNLKTGVKQSYPKNTKIDYSDQTHQIIIFSKEKSSLLLFDPLTGRKKSIKQISAYKMSPSGNRALIVKHSSERYYIGLLNLLENASLKWIAKDNTYNFHSLEWEEQERAVTFYAISDAPEEETSLYMYNLKTQKLSILNSKNKIFPPDKLFDKKTVYPITVSSDLQRVYFGLSPLHPSRALDKNEVETWNTADRWIFPLEKKSGKFSQKESLAVWNLDDESVVQITSSEFPKVILTGNKTHAVISDPKAYEPQFEPYSPRDFYIVDAKIGSKEILIKNQSENTVDMLPSPCGKYIAYYRDSNWWIYDIRQKTHLNITEKIKFPFFGRIHILGEESAYGNAGWSENDNEILLYDKYDIWAIKPNGKSIRRLTRGREIKTQFRLNILGDVDRYARNLDGYKSIKVDLKKRLVLRTQGDDGSTGIYTLFKGKLAKIVCEKSFINKIQFAEKKNTFLYCEQRFDLPPRLVLKNSNAIDKVVFQSNEQHEKYIWGRSELIRFNNSKGKEAKGVLYYPADYNEQKKYPMIVHIYEKQSSILHHYVNPTLYSGTGFNTAVLTSKGYFVLYPDIQHEKGTVGENTLDFTVSAVKNILDRHIVDPKKIGLIGHSFGGYETNYIITQTDLFATAVSGGSITDLTSFYLNVGWALSISDMSRFQSQQWRLGKTPFEDPALYAKNSPVANAAKINTPLLLWSGKEDWHTNWHQTIEFYMALRRLKKPGIMLLYPGEQHVLTKLENQKIHSQKTLQWFDYYLKDDHSFKWINDKN